METKLGSRLVEKVSLNDISGDISVSNLPVDLIIKSLNPNNHWAGVLGFFDVVDGEKRHSMRIKRNVGGRFAEFSETVFISPKEEPENDIQHCMIVQLLSGTFHSEEFFSCLEIEPFDAILEFNIKTKTKGENPPKNYPGMNPSKFIDWGLCFFDTLLKKKVKYIRDKWVDGSDTYKKFIEKLDFRSIKNYLDYEAQVKHRLEQAGKIQDGREGTDIKTETQEAILEKYFDYTERREGTLREQRYFQHTGEVPETTTLRLTEAEEEEYKEIEEAILESVRRSASARKYGTLGFTSIERVKIYKEDGNDGRVVYSLFKREDTTEVPASE
ncbi:hypothetical protein JW796_01395 [Candidatus Dojkabacteria bacterium]|nr:hypothetical protein [Candidatus Dojkabacteria bacterium]